jgi:hypothetical protein
MVVKVRHSPPAEKPATALNPAGELNLHAFFGNSKQRRRVALRKEFKFPQHDDFAAPRWQDKYRVHEKLNFFRPTKADVSRRDGIRDLDVREIYFRIDGRPSQPPDRIERYALCAAK